MTSKGQVTIPKKVRDALLLAPGDGVEFGVNGRGEVVVSRSVRTIPGGADRFENARGKAQIKWRTDDLMALLRPHD